MSSAEFIAECHQIDIKWAQRCAQFFPPRMAWLVNPQVWVRGDMIRVYFDVLSQNKLPAVKGLSSCYYSAPSNEIFFKIDFIYGLRSIGSKNLLSLRDSLFSGAKTRDGIKRDIREFLNEKKHWD